MLPLRSFLVLLLVVAGPSGGFNLDPRNVEVLSGRQFGDHFGYSLLLREDGGVLVGAPKGNSTWKRGAVAPGVLYTCHFRKRSCEEHPVNEVALKGPFELPDGALFSIAMDGGTSPTDSVTVCAPKLINTKKYYTNGACYSLNDFKKLSYLGRWEDQIGTYPVLYYKYALAEMGTSLKHLDGSGLLFGAPGLYSWSGGLLVDDGSSAMVSSGSNIGFMDYIGYSVEAGRFKRGSAEVWGVAGAPRAGRLLGEVKLFNIATFRTLQVLGGEQVGSYFGAAILAADASNDGADDLFVGAPTFSSGQYDEGCVYFYRNKGDGNFHNPIKIVGTHVAARFGTAIADLGDINHDSFKDIAISAPYERGTGAVYIYLGSSEGIREKHVQKILPEDFNPSMDIAGFGISISKGVDVDGNSYNDIAVGAYLSSRVVLVKARAIMRYDARLAASSKQFSPMENEDVVVEFCIKVLTDVQDLVPVETDLNLDVDDRVTSDFYQRTISVTKTPSCFNITLKLTNTFFASTNPIAISMSHQQRRKRSTGFCSNCPVVNPSDPFRTTLEIPFAHGCGDDGVCNTELSILGSFGDRESLVLGTASVVPLKISVRNDGEPAYLCQMLTVLPGGVGVAQVPTGCTLELQLLKCLVGNNFMRGGEWEMTFELDVSKVEADEKILKIYSNVSSAGQEATPVDNQIRTTLPVVLDTQPQVVGKAFPDQFNYVVDKDNDNEDIFVRHLFLISNLGRSPYDIQVTLAIPSKVNDLTVATTEAIQFSRNNEPGFLCQSANDSLGWDDSSSSSTLQTSRTVPVFCGSAAVECLYFSCNVGHIASSSHVVTISAKVKVNPELLEASGSKDIVALGSVVRVDMNGVKVVKEASTLFFVTKDQEPVPLWIIVLASVGGLLVVLVIVAIMWKCNFFRREYKEKILSEDGQKIIDANKAENN